MLQSGASAAPLPAVHLALSLAQPLAGRAQPSHVVMLTCGVLAHVGGSPSEAAHGGTCGFARVLRLEHPEMRVQTVSAARDISSPARLMQQLHLLANSELSGSAAPEAHQSSLSQCFVSSLVSIAVLNQSFISYTTVSAGNVLITGGLGGLAISVSQRLVTDGSATSLLLCSRSGNVAREGQGSEAVLTNIRASSTAYIVVQRCDVGDSSEVGALLAALTITSPGHCT